MAEVQGPDCLVAWQEGAKLLRASGGELFNLVTTVAAPCDYQEDWFLAHSPHTVAPRADHIVDVVNTIFPVRLQKRATSRADLYKAYHRVHKRAMKLPRNRSRWGTYFARLTDYGGKNNQLEIAITKLKKWPRYTTALVFHLSCPLVDKPRTRGGPCWHYGELIWRKGNVLDLVVVYRNHDFFNKALGNFIALGQLLRFIALESGMTAGNLICHSVHAYSPRPIKDLAALAKI